jgi:hypothetical protein
MVTIPLTQGQTALIDDIDALEILKYKWYAFRRKGKHTYYAARRTGHAGPLVQMHRQLMGFPDCEIDHCDGNGLNNQRCNLRKSTRSQNAANSRPRCGTSKFKGVHWERGRQKWVAQSTFNGRKSYIGRFATEIEAAKAYDAVALKLFGEFARLNFPPPLWAISTERTQYKYKNNER